MYLFVFVGLAWLLTAPVMALFLARAAQALSRRAVDRSTSDLVPADLWSGPRGGADDGGQWRALGAAN